MRLDLADIHHWTKADEEDIDSLQAQHLESERQGHECPKNGLAEVRSTIFNQGEAQY